MKSLVKNTLFRVKLNQQDAADLRKLVQLERRRRQDPSVGGATLLRELAIPRVRELLAAAQPAVAVPAA